MGVRQLRLTLYSSTTQSTQRASSFKHLTHTYICIYVTNMESRYHLQHKEKGGGFSLNGHLLKSQMSNTRSGSETSHSLCNKLSSYQFQLK